MRLEVFVGWLRAALGASRVLHPHRLPFTCSGFTPASLMTLGTTERNAPYLPVTAPPLPPRVHAQALFPQPLDVAILSETYQVIPLAAIATTGPATPSGGAWPYFFHP